MKRILSLLLLVLSIFTSCVNENEYNDNPRGNFEALWTIIDEHYCFFKEKNINWDSIKIKYAAQINKYMTDGQLFEVLGNMLSELRDGHVNMYTAHDYSRYWSWHENHPKNFSDTLLRRYLGTDYKIAAGIRYKILDDNIGYIYYNSFESPIGDGNLDDLLSYLMPCNSLIIDIRNNGGGNLTNAEKLAARFTNKQILVGYMRHKTGKDHNAFSSYQPQYINPSKGVRWHKKVAILTNRSVFSAANEFVKYMSTMPNATIIGDQTGGGAGMPFSGTLPNGWTVRFSACPMYDIYHKSTEDGIIPHFHIEQTDTDFMRGKDTIIEYARKFLSK